MHPMLVVIPNRNTRRMEMSNDINGLKENSIEEREEKTTSHEEKDTPQWELLFRIVLKYNTSPSGHNHRCQNQLSASTLNPR